MYFSNQVVNDFVKKEMIRTMLEKTNNRNQNVARIDRKQGYIDHNQARKLQKQIQSDLRRIKKAFYERSYLKKIIKTLTNILF